jgi:negative regulator of sigma-B (phosphoserine phosphatase)
MKIRSHHATRPKQGEIVNGDGVVERMDGAAYFAAVIDALGHGAPAAEVARSAIQFLQSVSLELDVKVIVEGLHGVLRGSRGAAAMICLLQNGVLTGCGVGNVELRVQGGQGVPVVLSPGVLGGYLRNLRVFEGEVGAGTRLVLFSDGISVRSPFDEMRKWSPSEATALLLSHHSHAHDDATVMVVDLEA